jgi:hypothetical protein
MTREERDLRDSLRRLAATDGGRRLLQLSLRGIETGEHELAAGCWSTKGDAGCLFQQSYWQGVAEGVFDDDGKARAWVSGVAGRDQYHRVIDVIAAFDRLARAEYATGSKRFGPPDLDRAAWRAAVSQMLVDVLGEQKTADREALSVI